MSRGRTPKQLAEGSITELYSGECPDLAGAPLEELIAVEDRTDVESTLLALDCHDLDLAVRHVIITAYEARHYSGNRPPNASEAENYAKALADSCETARLLIHAERIAGQVYISNFTGFDPNRMVALEEALAELSEACNQMVEFHSKRRSIGPTKEHYQVIAVRLRLMREEGLIKPEFLYSRTGPLVELFDHIVRLAGLDETTSAVHYLKKAFGKE